MPTALYVPELGIAPQQLCVSSWLVHVGDEIITGDRLVELLIPGITFDVSATVSGRLSEICQPVDSLVNTGDILGWIEGASA